MRMVISSTDDDMDNHTRRILLDKMLAFTAGSVWFGQIVNARL